MSGRELMNEATRVALESEYDFQDTLPLDPCEERPFTDTLVLLDVYLERAKKAWAYNKGDEKAAIELRKITAMCIRAMNREGMAVPRE